MYYKLILFLIKIIFITFKSVPWIKMKLFPEQIYLRTWHGFAVIKIDSCPSTCLWLTLPLGMAQAASFVVFILKVSETVQK